MDKEQIEALKEKILTKIDRHVKLKKISNEKVNDEWIERLTDEWINLMLEDLEEL